VYDLILHLSDVCVSLKEACDKVAA